MQCECPRLLTQFSIERCRISAHRCIGSETRAQGMGGSEMRVTYAWKSTPRAFAPARRPRGVTLKRYPFAGSEASARSKSIGWSGRCPGCKTTTG